jgi:hypothetical protein
MHLESLILIRRHPEQVWRFLSEISNIPKWDRGVAAVRQISSSATGVGFEFETLADPAAPGDAESQGRMSYRIAEVDPDQHRCAVQLKSTAGNARYFKTATWSFQVSPAPDGTLLRCSVDFVLRMRYLILAPIFYAMRGAIRTDLEQLKRVVEAEPADTVSPCGEGDG